MSDILNFTITDQRDVVSFDAVARLYESVGFGSEQLYLADSGYYAAYNSAGSFVILALDLSGNLIGMLRGFTDNKICTWIAELCVYPAWQKKGVGSGLITRLNQKYGHTAIYVDAFLGTEEFYKKHGMKPKQKLVACSRAGVAGLGPFVH